MTRIVWKISPCYLYYWWRFKFLEKALIWLKNLSSIRNQPVSKAEDFLKSNFDLNQICQIVLTQSHWIWGFKKTELLYIFIKGRRKALKLWKMSKIEVWRRLGQVMNKNLCTQTFPDKYLEQSKEINNWTGLKNFDI